MKKKTKFMTAILSVNEWNMIKVAMVNEEYHIQGFLTKYQFNPNSKTYKLITKKLEAIHHFNSISVDNIEDMADKIERERRKKSRDKPKQKASRNLANEPNS